MTPRSSRKFKEKKKCSDAEVFDVEMSAYTRVLYQNLASTHLSIFSYCQFILLERVSKNDWVLVFKTYGWLIYII